MKDTLLFDHWRDYSRNEAVHRMRQKDLQDFMAREIRKIRVSLGPLREIAGKMGISHMYLSDVENGRRGITQKFMDSFEELLQDKN